MILIFEYSYLKAFVCILADFGLAIDLAQERPVTRLGTLDYMAPEVRQQAIALFHQPVGCHLNSVMQGRSQLL